MIALLLILAQSWPLVSERQTRAPPAELAPEGRLRVADLAAGLARVAPSGAVSPALLEQAKTLGFELQVRGDVAALFQPAPPWDGRPVLLLRLGPLPTELILQAPHPTSDLKTGELSALLFDGGGARAAMFSTVHRDTLDAAHDPEGAFQAITLGLARGLPNPLFVQIHGFAAETSSADLVVSLGMGLGDGDCVARQVGAALLAADVRTGAQEPALAATRNAQSQLLRARARFTHLELSKPLREALIAEPLRRELLMTTLLDLASGAQCGSAR